MSCVRRASLLEPATLKVCAWLLGHNDIRPRPGADEESSMRSGLSQTSVSSLLLNHEPS